jgi:hypothetical protein
MRAQPLGRIKLHFIPSCGYGRYAEQMLRNLCAVRRRDAQFPAPTSSLQLARFCDSVTDSFRVISPNNFRVMTSTGYKP